MTMVSVPSSFQSTPPRGRRLRQLCLLDAVLGISIHASAREATKAGGAVYGMAAISIHASAREATGRAGTVRLYCYIFQSTPPRGRRPSGADYRLPVVRQISIHASAREATQRSSRITPVGAFQSTPPRGRRPARRVLCTMLNYFNPRLREGGDDCPADALPDIDPISIHASAREATYRRYHYSGDADFNPRLREGGDRTAQQRRPSPKKFQSTPPRGRRLRQLCLLDAVLGISIHASAREATIGTGRTWRH